MTLQYNRTLKNHLKIFQLSILQHESLHRNIHRAIWKIQDKSDPPEDVDVYVKNNGQHFDFLHILYLFSQLTVNIIGKNYMS